MRKMFFALFCALVFVVSAQAQTITVSFRTPDDSKGKWPFAEKKFAKDASVTEATVTLKGTKYLFDFESSSPMYLNSKFGLMFGGEAGNYIKLPAVKGKTLTKVSLKFGGKGNVGRPAITDVKGNILEGGKPTKSPEENYVHTWEVSGLKKSKPAHITLTHDSSVKIKEIILEYK